MRLRAVSSDGTQTGGGLTPFRSTWTRGRQRTGSQALCLLPAVDTTLGRVFYTVCLEASHWSERVHLSSYAQVAGVCYKAGPGGTTSLCSCSPSISVSSSFYHITLFLLPIYFSVLFLLPHHSVLAPHLFQCPLPSFSLHWDFTF